MSNKISALEHMIENDLPYYSCNMWSGKEMAKHFESLDKFIHQVNYKGEIFFITKERGGG